MSDDYAPFDEQGLEALAQYHISVAGSMKSSWAKGLQIDRAAACRNAVKAQTALRDRCHLAEHNLRNAEAILTANGIAFQRAEVEASEVVT